MKNARMLHRPPRPDRNATKALSCSAARLSVIIFAAPSTPVSAAATAAAITLARLDRRRRDLPTDASALIPQRGDPALNRLDHGLTIETGVAHCRIIVVARLVSPVFRVFLAARIDAVAWLPVTLLISADELCIGQYVAPHCLLDLRFCRAS